MFWSVPDFIGDHNLSLGGFLVRLKSPRFSFYLHFISCPVLAIIGVSSYLFPPTLAQFIYNSIFIGEGNPDGWAAAFPLVYTVCVGGFVSRVYISVLIYRCSNVLICPKQKALMISTLLRMLLVLASLVNTRLN